MDVDTLFSNDLAKKLTESMEKTMIYRGSFNIISIQDFMEDLLDIGQSKEELLDDYLKYLHDFKIPENNISGFNRKYFIVTDWFGKPLYVFLKFFDEFRKDLLDGSMKVELGFANNDNREPLSIYKSDDKSVICTFFPRH